METWKAIPGYEGIYEVSDQGNVRSVDRRDFSGARRTGRAINPFTTDRGYLQVELNKCGEGRKHLVHRLVLTAFVGPCPEGMVGCHFNDVGTDNRLENLRWDTPRANTYDSIRLGTNKETRKTHCKWGHVLKMPNLKPGGLEYGHRQCLACGRARNYIYTRKHLEPHFLAIADEKYHEIMTKEGSQSTH